MMASQNFEIVKLGSLAVPRIWMGLWQLSSPAWGTAPASKIRAEMKRHLQYGFTTFDMADHYGSSEILYGQFRKSLLASATSSSPHPIGATKWCVFRSPSVPYDRKGVEEAVRERMSRMLSDGVDILQLHWQNYDDLGYMDVIRHLLDIKRDGKLRIDELGLVNFDSRRVNEICETFGPGALVTNQVQFSLVDTRPLHGMAVVCAEHQIKLLTYGTLCGGFLADKWLNRPQPDPYFDSLTPSQRKYLDVILGAWGGWELFQTLLSVLRTIGDRHNGLSVSNVATRWVLDHDFVAAVIVGARLGVTEHKDDNVHAFGFRLSKQDKSDIANVLAQSNEHRLIHVMGDCGAEYR